MIDSYLKKTGDEMKKKLLIVVDYQKDFVVGTLGFNEAQEIESAICDKIKQYRDLGEDGQIIFTMDTHDKDYLDTQEGINLPISHCIKGLDGWELYGQVKELKRDEDLVFSKPTFGSLELGDYLRNKGDDYESVELVGVVTNICVISNMVIVKAAMPEVPILVDERCVASNDEKYGNAALDVMKTLHVNVKRR